MELLIESKRYGSHIVYYDDDDHELISKYKWRVVKSKNGFYVYTSTYSRVTKKSGGMIMHKLIMGRVGVDHINHNGLDNRKSNLRFASQRQNAKNQPLSSSNKTGWKGVAWDKEKQKYESYITVDYKKISGGYFNNPIDAAKKYNELSLLYHKEFGHRNVITKEDEDKYSHIMGRYLKARITNKSGYRGVKMVTWPSGRVKYLVIIKDNSKKEKYFGSYDDPVEAAKEYNRVALIIRGDKALLNKIDND